MDKYEGLRFHHTVIPDEGDDDAAYGMPGDHKIEAIHPEHGVVGNIRYREEHRPGDVADWTDFPEHSVHVQMLKVKEQHRGRGVASAIMDHMEDRFKDVPIDHGVRTRPGEAWGSRYYNHHSKPATDYNHKGESWDEKSQSMKPIFYQADWTLNGKPYNIQTKKPMRRRLKPVAMKKTGEVNVPHGRDDLIAHAEGQQQLYKPAEGGMYGPGLCGAHALQHEQQRRVNFRDFGITHFSDDERLPERRWLSVGKGSCATCTRQQAEKIGQLPGGPKAPLDGPQPSPERRPRDRGPNHPQRQVPFDPTRFRGLSSSTSSAHEPLRLVPTGKQYNRFIDEYEVHGHGLDFGEGTHVKFERSRSPQLNNRIHVGRVTPGPIPGFSADMREDVGHMSYHPETGRVEGILTHEKYQRRGVATGMWNLAQRLHEEHGTVEPQHSETQTDEGKAWAQKVGELDRGHWFLYHGTSKENADRIEHEGFQGGHERHGQHSGEGFYFHEHPRQAAEYGSHIVVVEATPRDFSIHHNPYQDPDVDHRNVSESLKGMGFDGHRDPDDHAVILYHPHQIHYMTHGPAADFIGGKTAIRHGDYGSVVHDDGRKVEPDDMLTLYHETSAETAAHLRQHGTRMAKPAGERTVDSDYEPGRGMGKGIYLMHHPGRFDGVYGNTVLPVRVRAGDLAVPPERAHRIKAGMTPLKSLMIGDGYTEHELGPEAFGEPMHRTGALDPGAIEYSHEERESGGSKWPTHHSLKAHMDGQQVGELKYYTGKTGRTVLVDNMYVEPKHRGNGIASGLMDELQRRHGDASINHGDRTDDGKKWWAAYTKGKTVTRGRTARQVTADEDYFMRHRPGGPQEAEEEEGTAAPAHALDRVFPPDVYDKPHHYGTGEGLHGGQKAFRETVHTLRSIRGNPEAPVTMYRSLPPEHAHTGFRTGDWVSVHGEYARGHGLHNEDEHKDWPVIKATVPAKHLWNNGDSLDEFGYHGPPIQHAQIHFPGGRDAQIHADPEGHIRPFAKEAGLHGDLPEGLHFTYKPSEPEYAYPGARPTQSEHVIRAHIPGEPHPIGKLHIDPHDHVVNVVQVHPLYRRRGIANGMWDHALSLNLNPHHDDGSVRRSPILLPNGKAWADAEKSRKYEKPEREPAEQLSMFGNFTPTKRVFTHTCGLDHRLWEKDGRLKYDVRRYIMGSVAIMWVGYQDWSKWSIVYFAGSEASEWTDTNLEGNNDFDVLIGVDYNGFRNANPSYRELPDQAITDMFNEGFKAYNGPVLITIDGKEQGPFDRTTYVNHDSYDITRIKPYAAYNVSADVWAVKPPHLPHWSLSELPEAVQTVLRAADHYAHEVLALPEPERTQQGAALFDSWHSDRSRAFGPEGEGWWDIANLREKWLDQEGVWAQLVDCKHRANEGLAAAPANWSNTPKFGRLNVFSSGCESFNQ